MELFQRSLEWEQELKGEEAAIKNIESKALKIQQKLQKKKVKLEQKKENDWDWEERRLQERLR